jgi:hypothetical protein
VRRPEKVAEVWPACAAVDDLFLNFLFLFFSRKKEKEKKRKREISCYKVPMSLSSLNTMKINKKGSFIRKSLLKKLHAEALA